MCMCATAHAWTVSAEHADEAYHDKAKVRHFGQQKTWKHKAQDASSVGVPPD